MKFLQNKEISKKIIMVILLVMSFNFISPTISRADADEIGGVLFKPIAELLKFIGDTVIEGLQDMMLGDSEIKTSTSHIIDSSSTSIYSIKYGPGVIFSNIVPDLDVNFFNPKYDDDSPYVFNGNATYTYGYYNDLFEKFYPKNVEEIVDAICCITGLPDEAKNEAKVEIVADYNNRNEFSIKFTIRSYTVVLDVTKDGDIDNSDLDDFINFFAPESDDGSEEGFWYGSLEEFKTQLNSPIGDRTYKQIFDEFCSTTNEVVNSPITSEVEGSWNWFDGVKKRF